MLFILEGCDKCGKTTLADKLCKEYDATYMKFSAPKRHAYKEYSEALDMLQLNRSYVLDRFCYGELIYGPIYRKKSQVTLEDVRYLEVRMMSFDPVVICCLTHPDQIKQNFKTCNEELTKPEHIEQIIEGYKTLFFFNDQRLVSTLFYNYLTDMSHEKLFDHLRLMVFHEPLLKQTDLHNYIGNSFCGYLFVGDQKNPHLQQKAVFDSTSGRFLMRAVDQLGVLDRSGFCNSMVGNELLDRGLVERLNPRKIIALGKKAKKRLEYIGLKHGYVEHPQFAKRFFGKDYLDKYVSKLKQELK